MRIVTLFSSSANLSGIFEGDSPQLNSLYHKVHMEVNEKGTVAAAVSAAMVGTYLPYTDMWIKTVWVNH